QLIKIDTKTMKADPKAAAVLKPFQQGKEELKKEPIGVETEVMLDATRDSSNEGKSSIRHNETNLGNVIADAMLWKAKSMPNLKDEIVVSLQNGGGVRTSIE